MSITGVSSNTPSFQPNLQQNAVWQNFQQLTKALQSGDLSGAQTAYATLVQNLPSQNPNGSNTSTNPFQQAIATIGPDLQKGDLSGAQQALKTLQSQMKEMHHHHHQHGASQQASGRSLDVPASSQTSATSSVGLYA